MLLTVPPAGINGFDGLMLTLIEVGLTMLPPLTNPAKLLLFVVPAKPEVGVVMLGLGFVALLGLLLPK